MTDNNPTDRIDRVIDGVIQHMMAGEGPADLRRRVLARIEGDASKPGWFALRPTQTSLAIWAGGAVMAMVFVLLSIWSSGLWPSMDRLKPEHTEAANVSAPSKPPALAAPASPEAANVDPDPTVTARSTAASEPPTARRRKRIPEAAASEVFTDADSIQIAPVSAKVAAMEFAPVGPAQMTFEELSVQGVEIMAMELPPLSTGSAVPPLR